MNRGPLTVGPAVAQVGRGAPVAQQLISEAHGAPAPGPVPLRAGLQVDDGPVGAVRPEAERLPLAARGQQLQPPGPLREHAGPAEGRSGLDADRGGAPGPRQVGLEDHPESLARVDPPHRALRAAQPHLEHDPRVRASCETAGSAGGDRGFNHSTV